MDFGAKAPIEVISKVALEVETFILMLMESGTKSHRKNVIIWKILIRYLIVQIIVMSMSINLVLNVEHC